VIRRLDHVGLAVPDLEPAIAMFRDTFGAHITEVVEDPIQRVRLCFAEHDGGRVELIAPLTQDSPVTQILSKSGGGLYHLCYETDDLEAEFKRLRQQGFIPKGPPQPAVAFGGRRVQFLFHRTTQLIELVEAPS
jgi:methylmalonyl-CoA/ethylmalonyl-CoA epimerase